MGKLRFREIVSPIVSLVAHLSEHIEQCSFLCTWILVHAVAATHLFVAYVAIGIVVQKPHDRYRQFKPAHTGPLV